MKKNLSEIEVADAIRYQLSNLIGQRISPATKEDIKRSVNETMARMEADIYGHEVLKVTTLWEDYSRLEKVGWFLLNRVFSFVSNSWRSEIDEMNRVLYEEAMSEIDEEDEELIYPDYNRIKYPRLMETSPKTMILVDTKVRLVQPMKFISLNVQLDQLDRK